MNQSAAKTAEGSASSHPRNIPHPNSNLEEAHEFRQQGEAFQLQGDCAAAARMLEQALRLNPLCVGTWVSLSEVLFQNGEITPSLDCLKQALQLHPGDIRARLLLGNYQKQLGEQESAVGNYRYVLEHEPHNVAAAVNLASVLREQGQAPAAVTLLRGVIGRGSISPHILFNFANTLVDLGEFSEARQYYRTALATHPQPAKVFFNLASITRFSSEDRESLQQMQNHVAARLTTNDDQIYYHFALGKAHDDLEEFSTAFQHYQQANSLVVAAFDPEDHQRQVEGWMNCWSARFLHARQDWGHEAASPIFIVGMPRSGTTLVERLLAAHPEIHPLGERPELRLLIDQYEQSLGCDSGDLAAVGRLTQADVHQLAENYLRDVRLPAGTSHFTDKMPANFLWIGWIALCFPHARIIHCRRDPRDVCLSCYFQHFNAKIPYAYNLHHLVKYIRSYEQLMSHWGAVLPEKILDVQYENLVEAPDAETRRMLAFLGLSEGNESDFQPVQGGTVRTASAWQARQPIYKTSRQRWLKYRDHAGPLLEEFGCDAEQPVQSTR